MMGIETHTKITTLNRGNTVAVETLKKDKQKVSMTVDTYDKLKTVSRLNGVKMRLMIDAMVDLILQNEALTQRIIDAAIAKEAEEDQ